jgi:hypothetical protein
MIDHIDKVRKASSPFSGNWCKLRVAKTALDDDGTL